MRSTSKLPGKLVEKSSDKSSRNLWPIIKKLYTQNMSVLQHDWMQWVQTPALTTIFTPNPEQVVQAESNPAFATILLSADVLLPDGIGLVWAGRRLAAAAASKKTDVANLANAANTTNLTNVARSNAAAPTSSSVNNEAESFTPPLQRLSGRELVTWWLHTGNKMVDKTAQRTFLIGAQPGVGRSLAQQLDPARSWCQASVGYQDIRHPQSSEDDRLKSAIKNWRPAVVLVAFGAPWQETWISKHRGWLEQQGVRVAMAVGGSLDALSPSSGLKIPPSWITKLNLEWLYRLFKQPWRWRRQLRLLQFIKLVWQAENQIKSVSKQKHKKT